MVNEQSSNNIISKNFLISIMFHDKFIYRAHSASMNNVYIEVANAHILLLNDAIYYMCPSLSNAHNLSEIGALQKLKPLFA